MWHILGRLFLLALLGVLVLLAAAAALPVSGSSIHWFLPLPVACAGARCVPYREWVGAIRRAEQGTPGTVLSVQDRLRLLTELLTADAATTVARRTGLSVSDADVEQTLKAIDQVSADHQDVRRLLETLYGDLQDPQFRRGMRDLLLRQKLSASGIPNVWTHATAPTVTVLHLRYRWDADAFRVVER